MKASSFNLQRLMRALHTYSAMWVLLLLLFFSITGITLNHPNWHSQWGSYQRMELVALPVSLQLAEWPEQPLQQSLYANEVYRWVQQNFQLKATDWSYQFDEEDELLELEFKRAAGYAMVLVDFTVEEVEIEQSFAGYLALANDLHKGRDAGVLWSWLIDATAVSCLLFSLTGFYLLLKNKSQKSLGNSLALLGGISALLIYMASLH
ncbi:PepSY-associated TM helix domain-containing protein [Alkalimonas collagenimarina]|uniref:PepSY-associated TM helix domain-containing protein n=1 Tax=Alkalimonas collagenimarina TaxID=400390 RepID=A0ABT9GZS6_9GAMM|nr:PepSY-associated TM helix domain-containing protein [Alkalimonas collagenimarina]MDP4536533.1 PepSY-associated TM helix domain-containing protein [Alkalimonas collagenimarina]